MIRLCSCSGDSASNIDPVRKQIVTASCKICGGKPLGDRRASLSGSMLSTGLPELTGAINPELTWKTISKGNRSASRRARKPISRNYQRTGALLDKQPEKVEEMPVSESEKLGVTVLGRRFSDKVENIPIKKRRFLFRSPSPPPRASSPHVDDPCQHALGQESSLNATVAKNTPVQLGEVGDAGSGKYLKEMGRNLGESEDFSGISILAAAACNNSMDNSTDNEEDGSALEVSSVQERSYDVPVNNESCLMGKDACSRGLGLNSAEISDEGTGSCISAMHVEETIASLVITTSSAEDIMCKTDAEAHISVDKILSAERESALPSDRDETISGRHETLLDDRSQWDLNTVMDAWQSPSHGRTVDPQEDGIGDIADGGCNENSGKVEACELQREPVTTKFEIGNMVQPVVGSVVGDEDEYICCHTESRCSAVGCDKSNRVDHNVDAHAVEGNCEQTTLFQGKASSEIDSGPNMMALDNGSKSMHNQELSTNIGGHQVVDKDTCMNNCSLAVADEGSGSPVSEEDGHAASPGANGSGKEGGDDYPAKAERAEHICSNPQSVKDCITLPCEVIPGAVSRDEKICAEDGKDAGGTSGVHVDGNFPNKPQSPHHVACDPVQSKPPDSGMDYAICSSEIVHRSPSAPCDELPGSEASGGSGEHGVGVALKAQDGKDFEDDAAMGSPEQIECEKLTHNPFEATAETVEAPGGISSNEAHRSCSDDLINISGGDVAAEDDHFDDVDYGSDISQDDPQGMERENEPQVDYDSQYEDGELRESSLHGWEGDAYEEGEAENVDYGSDNRETFDFESAEKTDCPGSMSVHVEELTGRQERRSAEINGGCERDQVMDKTMLEKTVLHEENCAKRSGKFSRHSRGQFGERDNRNAFEMDPRSDNEFWGGGAKVNEDDEHYASGHAGNGSTQSESLKMKFSGWDKLPEGGRSSVDTKVEARDGDSKRLHSVACMDGPDSGHSAARMAMRRELHSRIEGPTSSDILHRKDRFSKLDDPNRRVERGGSSLLHMHGRGRVADRWIDSSRWGSERRTTGFVHPGPNNAAAAAAVKIKNSGLVVAPDGTVVKAGVVGRHRQSANQSSEGVRRSLARRGSPSDRDEALGMHMEPDLVGEMSPDRSIAVGRGRSGRFGPRVVGSGLRERYRELAPDDSSLRMQHPSVTRERSYSPIQRRGAPQMPRSRTNSPSRSRTRSPHDWASPPRGRNGFGISGGPVFRHHSRSPPNFRSEVRTDRVRSPHRRPGFFAEHATGFAPTSRARGSPQFSSRWVENRKDAADHFREHGFKQRMQDSERRLPGRIFPRSHRFDLVGSTGRSKPDEYYRPIHHGRFTEMDGAGRGSRYDASNDDRRKHGHRNEFVHHARRYDTDGHVKRFRYDVEDGFAAHDSNDKDPVEFHRRGSPKAYERGIDSRLGDAPRRTRDEKGHFRYGRDWKYNSDSKSFGMR